MVARQSVPCTDSPGDRLQELSGRSEAWRRFESAVAAVTEWLDSADRLLGERADTEAAVLQHKVPDTCRPTALDRADSAPYLIRPAV